MYTTHLMDSGRKITSMKKSTLKILFPSLTMIICLACAESHWSHTETARIVVESFYQDELPTLQKHTTARSFSSFMNIRNQISAPAVQDSEFEVLRDTIIDGTAWVKFNTAFEEQPETFKLIKENSRWKVSEIEIGEKSPFQAKHLF